MFCSPINCNSTRLCAWNHEIICVHYSGYKGAKNQALNRKITDCCRWNPAHHRSMPATPEGLREERSLHLLVKHTHLNEGEKNQHYKSNELIT